MHESLAEALLLRQSVISVRHLREIGIHAGIPASVTDHAVARVEILNIVTLAGGANEGAGAAAEAGL